MNAAMLLIPLFLIRYGLLALVNKVALPKAAHFPPMQKNEKVMLCIYQLSTVSILAYMFFLRVTIATVVSQIGLCTYVIGVALFAVATVNFAQSSTGINKNGLYCISRNPMYIGYFICFLGCGLLTRSIFMLILVSTFQTAAHWIILAEERWCIQSYGDEYIKYMNTVRRYI